MNAEFDLPNDTYSLVARLLRLRDLLCQQQLSYAEIVAHLPDDYNPAPKVRRQFRRDLKNLEALGYQIERRSRPYRWRVSGQNHLLSDEDIETLGLIRDAFERRHPFSNKVQNLLQHLTSQLTEQQEHIWNHAPILQLLASQPALDYSAYMPLVEWLNNAIHRGQQIALLYRPRLQEDEVFHERLDPYEIMFIDRHFYLHAFSYRYGILLDLRLDRIVYDQQRNSPEILRHRRQPRRYRKPITFRYSLPRSFARSGVSERFEIVDVYEDGDNVIVTACHTNEFYIMRTLLSYGEHAQLLDGPASLIKQMRTASQAMWEHYQAFESV